MDNQSAASAIPFLSENAAKRSLSFRQVTRNNFLISSDAYLRAQKVKDTFVTIVGGKIIRFARTSGTDSTLALGPFVRSHATNCHAGLSVTSTPIMEELGKSVVQLVYSQCKNVTVSVILTTRGPSSSRLTNARRSVICTE